MENVDIVKLPEMRVARFHAFGKTPELEAIRKMQEWAKPRKFIDDAGKYPVWGFDNPSPEPGKAEHGYEVWVKVDDEVRDDNVEFLNVPARDYAHLYSDGFQNIGPNWKKLVEWVKNSNEWECAGGQCIEGHVFGSSEDGDFALDLYEPVKRK